MDGCLLCVVGKESRPEKKMTLIYWNPKSITLPYPFEFDSVVSVFI